MRKRDLLKHVSAFVLFSSAFGITDGMSDELDPGVRIRVHVASLFGNMNAAASIGAAFLSAHPAEADTDKLVAAIIGAGAPPPTAGLDAWLGARIAADFDAGDVTLVEGWLFSRCEARLCALASMMQEAA